MFTGNSPGLSRQVFASLSGGQTQVADFSNATGTAGPPLGSSGTQLSGWGVIEYGQTAANVATNPGFLQITSTPSTKAIFKFTTVQDGGTYRLTRRADKAGWTPSPSPRGRGHGPILA